MFAPDRSGAPRVFGLPPGVDTPRVLARKVAEWRTEFSPVDVARGRIFTNTRRLARRIGAALTDGSVTLLPRVDVLTDPVALAPDAAMPTPLWTTDIALELFPTVAKVLSSADGLAPRSAALDLSISLAKLAEEITGEDVDFGRLGQDPTGEATEYWAQSAEFLAIVSDYLSRAAQGGPEARRKLAVRHLTSAWAREPTEDVVLVLGSTGSRKTTSDFMRAVARLPRGAVVLPGFDFDLPPDIFAALPEGPEDHPQFRNAVFLRSLGLGHEDVAPWADAVAPARARLTSLALRPAPVTAGWRRDAPALGDLAPVTRDLTLVEAPNARLEAASIAVAIRQAVEDGRSVALVTPDRTLGRRVDAALARWNIRADDSSGRPLALTPPGRFLRLVEKLCAEGPTPESLIALLKHPLAASTEGERLPHLALTRAFEVHLRKAGVPDVDRALVEAFRTAAEGRARDAWCAWLVEIVERDLSAPWPEPIFHLAEHVARGSRGTAFGGLWDRREGEAARDFAREMAGLSDAVGGLAAQDLRTLFQRQMMEVQVRSDDPVHPGVHILGTLEARGQSADVVILGGLNEGVWPAAPSPDPWLNREMRAALGLLSPERETGLAGHDFQQAASAPEVILTRALRNSQAETVPSRWISRLTMLLEGLPDQNGPAAIADMKARGDDLVQAARVLDRPGTDVDPAVRPAPCPPPSVRPRDFTVTEVQTLIRDPYAIYARHVLKLARLDPLVPRPDARLKGILLHQIVETAVRDGLDRDPAAIAEIASNLLADLPFPAEREAWAARAAVFAEPFAQLQAERAARVTGVWTEKRGKLDLGDDISIRGKADRIDALSDGTLSVIDYKSGTLPSRKQIIHFDRQLLIEAAMIEAGAFEDVPAAEVSEVVHVALKRSLEVRALTLAGDEELQPSRTMSELLRLLRAYLAPDRGYASRRAMEEMSYSGDYDHLARFGEWDIAETPTRIALP